MERTVGTGRKSVRQGKYPRRFAWAIVLLLLLLLVANRIIGTPTLVAHAQSGDWPTYMGDNARSGFNGAETIINPSTASHLKLHWQQSASGKVTTQVIEANGMLYWGSWDGIEHASNPATGHDVWTANLGTTKVMCSKVVHGVLSSAAFATVTIKGKKTPVIFVGGGNVQMYALNANTGAVIWQKPLGTQPDFFLYGSPLVYKGSVYIGVSSHGDCPLVQGQLVKLKATTGAIEHTFNVVPNGCTGGSVWTAPTIDSATNIIYFSTGNEGTCSPSETMTDALIAVNSSDLSLAGSWQVPTSQQIVDGDFGSTPTLFQATIQGTLHQMVGLINKNGIYYAFDRSNISAGPLWQVQLGQPPVPGGDNVSSSAWDGTHLYMAAASTTINGKNCAGSLRALNPADGSFIWQDCLTNDVSSPVTMVTGLAVVSAGPSFIVVNATTGNQLFSFSDTTKSSSNFLGPSSISNGQLFQGNNDGFLYAFGT